MNDKKFLAEKDAEKATGARSSRHGVCGAIVAAVICLLLALVVWVGVMNTQDTDYIPVRIEGPEGYECTLSVDGVEVEGKVSQLRCLDEIVVKLTDSDIEEFRYYDYDGDGNNNVNEALLQLPDGVYTTREFSAVLTVKAK